MSDRKLFGLRKVVNNVFGSKIKYFALIMFAVMFLSSEVRAAPFSGSGAGTVGDPYQITTPAQLNEVRNSLASHYKLMNDIDLTSYLASGDGFTAWGASGWMPIGHTGTGTTYNGFTGVFDGNFKKISGLFIDRPTLGIVGLFSGISDTATIKNIWVDISGDIVGTQQVGVLLGGNNGNVNNSHATSTSGIVKTSSQMSGGLVGANYINITDSSAKVNITSTNSEVGGLVGRNNGNIQRSFATGNVIGTSKLGGLAGSHYYPTTTIEISNSYSTGNVTSSNNSYYVAGFVGDVQKPITNCYSVGAVTTTYSNTSYKGGFSGRAGSTTSGSFFNSETSIITTNPDMNGLTSSTTVNMQAQPTSIYTGWDFTNVWEWKAGSGVYPTLRAIPNPTGGGQVTEWTDVTNGTILSSSTGVGVGNGNIYVMRNDGANGGVLKKFSSDAWTDILAPAGLFAIGGITVSNNGIVYAYLRDASYNIYVYKYNGSWIDITYNRGNVTNNPEDLVLDASGNLYSVEGRTQIGQTIHKLSSGATTWEDYAPTQQFNYPQGMAFESDDNDYVMNWNAGNILKRDISTGAWAVLGNGPSSGSKMVIDASNHFYVTEYDSMMGGGTNIYYSADGLNWDNSPTGDGNFQAPVDIAIGNSGGIYVIDGTNGTLKRLGAAEQIIVQSFTDINITNSTIVENNTIGDVIGILDADNGVTKTFTLTCNDSNFTIDGTSLKAGIVFDYETTTSQMVCIRVTDEANATYDENMTITITNINDVVPTVTSSAVTTATENSAYSYSLTGSDLEGDSLTWAVTNSTTFPSWLSLSSDANISTFAGSTSGFTDATGVNAQFSSPSGVATDSSNNIYVADTSNNRIRKITPDGVVTTFAGSGTYSSTDGTGTVATFKGPSGVAIDSQGNIYVAEPEDNKIRKITPVGVVTTFAGSGAYGSTDGTGTAATFNMPTGVTTDSSDNIYVAEAGGNKIRKITPAGVVTTFAGSTYGFADGTGTAAKFDGPYGVTTDTSDNIYVADTNNHKIRKITPAGVVTTLAGSTSGSTDGTGIDAMFKYPNGVTVDNSGNIYVADTYNNRIRKITPAGVVTTLAGSSSGFADGTGTDAMFASPYGITIDSSGDIFVADAGNNKIRKIIQKAKLIGTPTNADVGVNDVNITLSDGVNTFEYNFQITVENVNDTPTSADFNITINEDANKTFALNDFNFTDVDSGAIFNSIIITSLPSKGTLKLSGVDVTANQSIVVANIGNLVYIPVADGNGNPYTSFGFKVNDGETNSTSSYTATINVTPIDDALTFTSISNYTNQSEDLNLSITLVSNDVDNNTSLITYSAESNNTSIATVSIVDGKLVVTPVANKYGTITVEVNATSNGQTVTQNFEVEITNLNDTPTLASLSNIIKSEDFSTFNVTITPSDVDSDNLKLSVDMNTSGIISIPTNSTDWIPSANYSGGLNLPITAIANKYGTTELNVTVEDSSGATTSELFTITVNPSDDAPIASSMAATVGPNSQNTFDKFTPNFSDTEGDNPIMLKIVTLPTIGTFETNTTSGDGSWTTITTAPFEVAMGDLAKYRFNAGNNNGLSTDVNWSIMTSYDNTYGHGLWSNVATGVVTIIDPASNNAPDVNITSGGNDINGTVLTINEDGKTDPIYITFSDDYTPSAFLVGVIDSNDTSKVSLSDGDFNITRISDNNVSVVITPKANLYGDVNITLGAFDGDKNGTKSFTLRIESVNDIPTALGFEKTIDEDSNYSFSALNPSDVYSDINDSTQNTNETYPDIFQIVTLPAHGILHLGDNIALSADANISINNLSSLVYTPQENNNTAVSFTWRAFDGESWTEIKTATIHINPVDDAPVLATISNVSKQEDASDFNITLVSSDVEGNTITYSATSSDTSKATVSIVDGKVVVSPIGNKSGTVTITVNATANGLITTRTFTVDIENTNDTPTIDTTFSNISLLEDSETINYELNVSDVDGDDLNVTVTSSDSNIVTVHPNWNGLLNLASYSQPLDFNITTVPNASGVVTITLTVRDINGATDTTSFDINVTSVNDAPTLATISNVIVYKNSGDKNITINGSDVDGNTLTYGAVATHSNLFDSVTFSSNVLRVALKNNVIGNSDINVTVTDGTLSASKTFNFYILPLEDGTDTSKVNDINVTTENNTTTTALNISDTLKVQTQEDTNGTVSHEIFVGGVEIKATSEINGSVSEFTDNGVHTTYNSGGGVNLEVNATLDGKATHTLTTTNGTTTATSEFVGAQTVIKKDLNNKVEIETSVQVNPNSTVKVVAKEDGTAEHTVTTNGKTSTTLAKIEGATTTITTSGSVETSAGGTSNNGYTIKAKVVTDENGKSRTSFVKVKDSDKTETSLGNTVKSTTPFEAGNNVEIEDISGTLYMKIEAPLSNTNLIIE